MSSGIRRIEAVFISSSNPVLTDSRRNVLHVLTCDGPRVKCRTNLIRSRYSKANLLCEQNSHGSGNALSPPQEGYFSTNPCYSEIAPFFQAHTVIVLTEHPLQALLRIVEFSNRIAKWGVFLGAFDIQYEPRTSIKG